MVTLARNIYTVFDSLACIIRAGILRVCGPYFFQVPPRGEENVGIVKYWPIFFLGFPQFLLEHLPNFALT